LIVTILLLVVITLLALSSSRTSSLEEKMTQSLRSRVLALESAEAALAEARLELRGGRTGSTRAKEFETPGDFTEDCGTAAAVVTTTTRTTARRGLCAEAPPTATQPSWKQYFNAVATNRGAFARSGGNAVSNLPSGSSFGTAAVTAQPRYIFERIAAMVPGESYGSDADPRVGYKFRVTAQGFGSMPESSAWLQETVRYLPER